MTDTKTTNWTSVETWERLVASIVASGVKLDLKTIAGYYGTTYHTLENRFRKIKKDAEALKAGAKGENGHEIVPSPSPAKGGTKTPRISKTPKKDPLETVANDRVEKKTLTKRTPTKKTPVKKEQSDDEDAVGSVTGNNDSDLDAPHVDDDMFT